MMTSAVLIWALGARYADFGVPSNSLQHIEFKAEVVELADTPSKSLNYVFSVTSAE
jgi:hypothetical protein